MGFLAHSAYQAETGSKTDYRYRLATGPIEAIVRPGSTVETSYGTGPYVVLRVAGPYTSGWFTKDVYPAHWSLCLATVANLSDPLKRRPKEDSWINEVVPVDGRLLKLFEVNTDEVFVTGFHDGIVRLLREPKPVQLSLF